MNHKNSRLPSHKSNTKRKTDSYGFVALEVPIDINVDWYKSCKAVLGGAERDWEISTHQDGSTYCHITLAYLFSAPKGVDIDGLINECINRNVAPVIDFDIIDAFTTRSNHNPKHIVHLGASKLTDDFNTLVNDVRNTLESAGCVLSPDFRFHSTLCEISCDQITLEELKKSTKEVKFNGFSMSLTKMYFYKRHPKDIKWHELKQRDDK